MKYLLAGNGINIQFDRYNYSAKQIVLRLLKYLDRDDFPSAIINDRPYLMKNYFAILYLEARKIVKGEYDNYAFGTAEKKSLASFKDKYSPMITTLQITDIGFEDFYLIHDLVCHKTKTVNPDQYIIRESMRMGYLLSIYNDGALNQLYTHYPKRFVDYLKGFDGIFTTNYDSNLESATQGTVYHIHGQFDKKSDVYDANSLRNKLPDAPLKTIDIDEKYYFLYSNALSTHCGDYKEFLIKQSKFANSGLEKLVRGYAENPMIREDVDSWIGHANHIVSNMGYAVQLKLKNPELMFTSNYHYEEFGAITGHLEILGLSPWNDFHIFDTVDKSSLDEVIYYYYVEDECKMIERLLPTKNRDKKLLFSPVVTFWERLE